MALHGASIGLLGTRRWQGDMPHSGDARTIFVTATGLNIVGRNPSNFAASERIMLLSFCNARVSAPFPKAPRGSA